jgi:hypothetical protein
MNGGTYLTGRECAALSGLLRSVNRHTLSRVDPSLHEAVEQIHQAAADYQRELRNTMLQIATSPEVERRETLCVAEDFGAVPCKWISTAEAARILGCSPQFARRLADMGAIKARRTDKGAWQVEETETRLYAEIRAVSPRSRPRKGAHHGASVRPADAGT